MNPNQIFIDKGRKFVMSVTGGGQGIVDDLTRHGGMSGVLLEAIVPYCPESYKEFVGGKVDQIVSRYSASAAAMACYQRALKYAPNDRVFGLASTAALVKVPAERDGRIHRMFVGIQQPTKTEIGTIIFGTGRTREEEEDLARRCVMQMIRRGFQYYFDVVPELNGNVGDSFSLSSVDAFDYEYNLIHNLIDTDSNTDVKALFSSSCNPIHDGHLAIIEAGAKRLGCKVHVELCVKNPDKPPLDYMTLRERSQVTEGKIRGNPSVAGFVRTNVPLFFDKVKLFPGATFLVGQDTFDRIINPTYYPGGGNAVMGGLWEMKKYKNRFLVFPRKGYTPKVLVDDGEKSLLQVSLPMTDFVTEREFDPDEISSTLLRGMSDAVNT